MTKKYSVKGLAELSGVSVRTLHHYDQIGLLKPAIRNGANYRWYGENELLKLQQILFFKELDFSLKEIADLLNDPGFELIKALERHKKGLMAKQKRFSLMLDTIDKTVSKLKGKKMITHEELYNGFSKDAKNYRQEAIESYGQDQIDKSENYLKNLTREQLEQLKQDQKENWRNLFKLSGKDPESETVQMEIARHYQIIRKFWGTYGSSDAQATAYAGLGDLYMQDDRFTIIDGQPQPDFARFLQKAMSFFANRQLS